MRVNLDSHWYNDPRSRRLAFELELDLDLVTGKVLRVWLPAYERRSPLMARVDVDAAASLKGFADAMVRCDLAQDLGDGLLRLRGVEERIEFLLRQQAKWEKSAEVRAAARAPAAAPAQAAAVPRQEPRLKPSSPDLPPSRSPDTTPEERAAPPPLRLVESRPTGKKAKAETNPAHAELRAAVLALYLEHTKGAQHPWGPKEAGQLAQILRLPGATPEIVRERAERLWRDTPAWMAKDGPPTLSTLLSQWAALARPTRGAGVGRVKPAEPHEFAGGVVELGNDA